MLMDQDMAEGFTRLTWEIEEIEGGVTKLTIHDLEGAPQLAALVGGRDGERGRRWRVERDPQRSEAARDRRAGSGLSLPVASHVWKSASAS
jgi:hypothetical protein